MPASQSAATSQAMYTMGAQLPAVASALAGRGAALARLAAEESQLLEDEEVTLQTLSRAPSASPGRWGIFRPETALFPALVPRRPARLY